MLSDLNEKYHETITEIVNLFKRRVNHGGSKQRGIINSIK